jgi:adenylosuccinate synthase
MKIDILLGLQWGDEGKGKVVDLLTQHYDLIARFQGGPNAGHSLEFNGIKHVLHTIPSGIFHSQKRNIIGNGVVIDPAIFKEEIDALTLMGVKATDNLLLSSRANLILPTHRLLDAALEARKGKAKIGSTLKGIGPAYTDKIARHGLRIGDIFIPQFKQKYETLKAQHIDQLKAERFDYEAKLIEMETSFFEGIACIENFQIIESEYFINDELTKNSKILAEGAQGSLLDVDFGSYPFVTSSNTTAAGALTGLGIAPSKVGRVIGIVKAYCTRVGSGPFPTELFDETGELLRKNGVEFGATTGRPRRCGWLDLPALKYAIMLSGVTEIVLTKADVLTGLDEIKVCTAYKINGKMTQELPYNIDTQIEPMYVVFPGWKEDISKMTSFEQLPENFKNYLNFIEQETGIKISVVSVGPDRNASIRLATNH